MKISKEKQDKISEQILSLLFEKSPKMIFTSHIAKEIVRDEEFTKKILKDLLKRDLVVEIKKNKEGLIYSKRSRWGLSDKVYNSYKSILKN